MIEINTHPIWQKILPVKKRAHLARINLARLYAKFYPGSKFIGVTGSVGKTSTVQASVAVLKSKMEVLATSPNLDPVLNIPITLLKCRPKHKKVILEMGIEYPGEMDFYLSLVRPETAILTRIYLAHSEFLGDIEDIVAEKEKLLKQLPDRGLAILNWDDPLIRALAEGTKARVFFYGTDEKNCHIWAGNMRIEDFRMVFELNYGVERIVVKSQFLGLHQVYPLLAAASLGVSMNLQLVNIRDALEKVEPPEHRLQPLPGLNGSIILDDTYNSSPIAAEEAIETLSQVLARRRIVVLGEMRELGEYSEQLHRELARQIYKTKIDLVFIGGGDARFVADELLKLGFIKERIQQNLQNSQIVASLIKVVAKGDVVLVKGSRALKMDEVVQRIIKKGR